VTADSQASPLVLRGYLRPHIAAGDSFRCTTPDGGMPSLVGSLATVRSRRRFGGGTGRRPVKGLPGGAGTRHAPLRGRWAGTHAAPAVGSLAAAMRPTDNQHVPPSPGATRRSGLAPELGSFRWDGGMLPWPRVQMSDPPPRFPVRVRRSALLLAGEDGARGRRRAPARVCAALRLMWPGGPQLVGGGHAVPPLRLSSAAHRSGPLPGQAGCDGGRLGSPADRFRLRRRAAAGRFPGTSGAWRGGAPDRSAASVERRLSAGRRTDRPYWPG
jgi:hypothetical protein